MTRLLLSAVLLCSAVACGAEEPETFGSIERVDSRLDALIPPGAKLEKLAEGFEWAEGPVWIEDGQYVLFSDIPNNAVMKWKEGEGLSTFLKPAGYTGDDPRGGESGSNGLLLDSLGRLVLCQHGDRRVARLEADGRFTTLVDRYCGRRLNSPNDATFHSSGDLYFTDPPYGLLGEDRKKLGELGFCGVYRLGTDARLTLLTDQMTAPNGITFSPNEKTLYVAQSDPKRAIWMAYGVQPDGTIDDGHVFFDATEWVGRLKGLPDGLKVDIEGNLFATGPGGVNIFAPDGTFLGRVNPGVPTANCCFGDDGRTLYITAERFLCRIKTSTRGCLAAARPGGQQADDGFVRLFDGKTFRGWHAADMSWWSIEDGAITGTITAEKPCQKNQYIFYEPGRNGDEAEKALPLFDSRGMMGDFELKLTHRIVSPHQVNGGFQYRSEHYEDGDCKGYQIDNNTQTPWLVRMYDEFGRHTLAWRGKRTRIGADGKLHSSDIAETPAEPHFELGKWHEYHLICRGTQMTLYVDGQLVGEVFDEDADNHDLRGLFAPQLHSGPPMVVQFKDILYKALPPTPSD